jgi:ankyrin repeat protein
LYRHLRDTTLAHHADPNLDEAGKNSPLFWSVRNGRPQVVALLLKNGADVDPKTRDSGDPLYVAVSRKYYDLIKMLVKAGANPNRESYEGLSPLELAKRNSDETAIIILSSAKRPRG